MRAFKVEPLSYAQLAAMARPATADMPEGLPWVLYDTQTFTQGTTIRLEFFTTLQTNKSLGNLDLAGSLTSGEYFLIHTIGLDILAPMTSTVAAAQNVGVIDDIQKILFGDAAAGGDAGRFTFSLLSKPIGPFPLSFLHASGGPTGFGWGTTTAEETVQYGNNGIFDGGFPFGRFLIPPTTNFSVILEWGGTVALTANYALKVWLNGVKYRPVR